MIGQLVASFPPGHGGLSPHKITEILAVLDDEKFSQGRIGPGQGRQLDSAIRSGAVQWITRSDIGEGIFSHLFNLASEANRARGWNFEIEGLTPALQATRYLADGAQHYDWHMDLGAGQTRRRKISVVAHLSDEQSFDGGSLQLTNGSVPVDAMQTAGTVTVFPSFVMHRVTPVTRGRRFAVVAWALGPPFR